LYLITPGPVSGYSLRRNTTVPVDFPGTVTEFASARLYSFRFDDANLGLLAEKKLTLAQVFALSPPENINARALPSGSIALSWDRAGTETSYKIYRAEETPDSFSLLASVNTTSYTDAAVVLGKTYYYTLASIKNNLESEKSVNYVSILAELAALSAPTGLNAVSLGTDSIMLSWNPVADAAAYKINRGFDEETVTTYAGTTASASYTVNGLSAGAGYYFTVSAINDFAESLPSNPVYGMTSQVPAIQPPAVVNASSLGNSSIQVSWNAVSGATGYKVYRASSSAGSYTFRADVYSTSYTDSGLSEGTTYYYKVSSVKDSQESAMSSGYASATTQSGGGTIDYPPVMPTGLVVSSVYSGSITLSWNSVPTATSYNVYRSNTQTGAEAKINTSPVIGTSYTDNVPAGAAYYYQVVGVNSSGESPRSDGAFAYAVSHYALSYYSSAQTLLLTAGSKHYYRLEVTKGNSYTIEWQNGNGQNAHDWIRVAAYQNNGTTIFSGAYQGYTNPRVFTATITGFVTVEAWNHYGSDNYNYQIYYY
jgi:fibronectin type 3 domain-containing protein